MAFAAPATGITVTSDVQYGASGGTRLAMDIYRRATLQGRHEPAAPMPALVFFNRATGADRSQPFYVAWARAAASKGIIGILPDLRPGNEAADCGVLIAYLSQHASELGIDGIAVYAGSGNVFAALPFVQDPKQTAITAAVMYYGSAPIAQFRLDLPVLYVRARARSTGRQRVDRVACLARRRAERAADAAQQRGRASRVRADRRQRRDTAGDRADAGLRQAGIVRGVSVGASRVTRRGDGRRVRPDAQVRRRGEGLRANRRVQAGRSAAAPRLRGSAPRRRRVRHRVRGVRQAEGQRGSATATWGCRPRARASRRGTRTPPSRGSRRFRRGSCRPSSSATRRSRHSGGATTSRRCSRDGESRLEQRANGADGPLDILVHARVLAAAPQFRPP